MIAKIGYPITGVTCVPGAHWHRSTWTPAANATRAKALLKKRQQQRNGETITSSSGTHSPGISERCSMSEQVAASRTTEKAAEGGALFKLIIFAVSLAVVPLSTYYGSQRLIWNGDSTFAAISAVFAANVVLVIYIVQSVYEDKKLNEPRREGPKIGETRKEK